MIGFPKPQRDERLNGKRREKRIERKDTSVIRAYVFARERDICRCCRKRRADSMHELIPRSLRGRRSRVNSVAVCGDGVNGCHGYLQRHEIVWDADPLRRAEDVLRFFPKTRQSAEWMQIAQGQQLISPPMHETEISE